MDAVRRHAGIGDDCQGNALRIVITGGAGMIGSHLADALLDRGHEIVIVDNFLTGIAAPGDCWPYRSRLPPGQPSQPG
jgi:nucleoside-diphosphate-sugar epimerase